MNYRPIIESAYNRSDWQGLLHDIFGRRVDFYSPAHRLDVGKALIRQAWFLGAITLADGQKIGIYEAELADGVELERNRVTVRNLLAQEWRGAGFAGAFQFCYKAGSSTLRFSYASETWSFDKDGNFRKESTDTRRFTYFLGEGHRSRTALQQFQELKKSDLTLADITRAFSVEAVSARFFADYKRNYEDIVEYVTGKRMVKSGGKWQEKETGKGDRRILSGFSAFENPEKAVRDYVKKLMGRLVFLQFIQKKGWLGVPKGRAWGEGDREFLQHLFDDHASSTFIDDVLEPLFDDINTRRKGDLANAKLGRNLLVPYLNGGLFEPDGADAADFPLPPEYLRALFDFFGSYNFTIDENDPEDAEVGVDPEMLSRIFENLLEDNKDKGAFYTPKSIVEYMCRESLTAYLQTDRPDAERPLVASFVRTHDAAPLAQDLRTEMLKRLEDVKICDPAIGSGAFPMGLLKELFACRAALGDPCAAHPAELKRRIFESNIYGVDIEKGAVDIARLRFWLALVVDEETPHALPNLDFKIMQGNSLLESFGGVPLDHVLEGGSAAVYKSGKKAGQKRSDYWQTVFAFDAQTALDEIARDKAALFSETDHELKKNLIKRINKNVKAFISSKLDPKSPYQSQIPDGQNDQFFLWHTWFSDVFNRSGKKGFDIVIGNPPYIQLQAKKGFLANIYKNEGFETFFKMGDIYCLFYEQAFLISHNQTIVSYITPNTWLQSLKFDQFRKYLLNAGSLEKVLILGKVFDATVDTNVFIFSVGRTSNSCRIDVSSETGEFVYSHEIKISSSHKKGGLLNLVSKTENSRLAEKILSASLSFDDYFEIFNGVKPFEKGKGTPPQTDEIMRTKPYVKDGSRPSHEWSPLMRGSLMYRYVNRWKNNYWIKYGRWLAAPRDPAIFESEEKLIVRQTGDRIVAMSIGKGFICRDNLHVCIPKVNGITKVALGIANSSLIDFVYSYINPEKGEALAQVKRQHVAMLPMPREFDGNMKCNIESLVDQVLQEKENNAEADTSELEAEIDALVYKLYGLTEDEIAVVEGRKN